MKINIKPGIENIALYHNDEMLGIVSYELFMLKILSPKQLIQYEKNPDKEKWDVRSIDINQALTHKNECIKYLY
jgi:hypothetical protein